MSQRDIRKRDLPMATGKLSEWSKEPHSKCGVRITSYRGFESLTFRKAESSGNRADTKQENESHSTLIFCLYDSGAQELAHSDLLAGKQNRRTVVCFLYVLDRFTENSSLPRMPSADCWDYEEIPHFLTEEIPHYKTRTAPKNSPCFSIRVRQYHLFYFYALYVVDLAVLLDEELTVTEEFDSLYLIGLYILYRSRGASVVVNDNRKVFILSGRYYETIRSHCNH